jgi:TRAP-type C4-dicarboxylate transport system permease small subunit
VAPASGLPVGLFYAAGIVFGASSCVIIVHELYRLVTGQIADADLIAISESEELSHSPDAAGRKQQA